MQSIEDKKQIVKDALAKLLIELRGNKSQFIFASENDISISIISNIEHGKKDPQLTTILKLAEAFNMPCDKFIKKLIQYLPENFSFIEK